MLGDSFIAISPLAINVGLESAREEKFGEQTLRASRSIPYFLQDEEKFYTGANSKEHVASYTSILVRVV